MLYQYRHHPRHPISRCEEAILILNDALSTQDGEYMKYTQPLTHEQLLCMQLLLNRCYTASVYMVRDQQPKVAVCTSSCPARLRRALACSQPWNPDKIITIDSSPSRCSNRASLFACMHKVVIRASLVREARHQAGLGDVRKKKNLRDRIGSLVVSKTALDLICRLEVPSSVKSASHRLYLEEAVFGDASRHSSITRSQHGGIKSKRSHRRCGRTRATKHAQRDSELTRGKTPCQSVPHQFKVILPCLPC